jgi:signal transduction histidine kinase
LILVGSAFFWLISIENDKKNLMENSISFISSISEMMKKSIRHDMLTVQRGHIQKTIENIGNSNSVERVSVFDSKGIVHYSCCTTTIGSRVSKESSVCNGCHHDLSRPGETLFGKKNWIIREDPGGKRILSYVDPIYNEPDCYSASCHVHSKDEKVLGILLSEFPLNPIDMKINDHIKSYSLYTISFITFSIIILSFVLWKFVLRPVRSLSKGMARISGGDLSHRIPANSNDEIGKLALSFNNMIDELSDSREMAERWTQTLEEEVDRKTEEIKQTQHKLIQSEKLAALGRVTADIAHEIRNPLTALGGFGRRLRKIASGNKEKEYSGYIVTEVDRLERILKDILNFSKDEKFAFERTPLSGIVNGAVEAFEALFDEKKIDVHVDCKTEESVLVDKTQLRQAVINLISNAVDAMPDGGLLSVRISNERLNEITYVVIHVSDTGGGINEEQMSLIFEPFHTTKEVGHGTGLGLSISKKIIEKHGGFIRASNNHHEGFTVSMYFPYQSAEDMFEKPCWEYMQCGRNTRGNDKCPAYPHFGRVCWVVAGTFCEGRVQGTYAQKSENCRKCDFFNSVNEESDQDQNT